MRQCARVKTLLPALLVAVLALMTQGYSMEISFLVGDVNLMHGGKSSALTMKSALKPGDIVSTGKSSLCTLKYNDGSNVEIRAESKIMLGNESVPGSSYVSLISGVVHGKFAKMQKGGTNKVYTPTAVCAIRGTEFTIAASGSGDSRVQLEEGKLQIRNPYGKVNINENENTDMGIAARPKTDRKSRKIDTWMEQKDREFEANPEATGDRYGSYMDTLENSSNTSSKKINEYDKSLARNSMRGKNSMEKANADIDGLDENMQDEMYLNNAARSSLDGIISGIGQDKTGLYQKFTQVKEECNKVAEQQRRNYEALQAVREAYRKAYDEIVKKHRDSVEQIKSYNKESVIPQ
jgi:hypothetical protein